MRNHDYSVDTGFLARALAEMIDDIDDYVAYLRSIGKHEKADRWAQDAEDLEREFADLLNPYDATFSNN